MAKHAHDHDHDDDPASSILDRGLAFDLDTLMQRRRALKLFTGAAVGGAAFALVGCGEDSPKAATPAATATSAGAVATAASGGSSATAVAVVSPIPTQATPASSCSGALPSETGGPYPGDGSNGPNVLTAVGIVRKDIRSSFGISETAADGIPLTIRLTVVDTKNGCKPMPGAALYLWHCDRAGNYSLYSAGVTDENYLRGVQVADGNGLVTFDTIFPGCYSGRWPHAHFEVFPSLQAASTSRNATITSQLALPEDVCQTVYAGAGYETSARNLSRITLKTDNVFSDGWALQMATVTGDAKSGYTADLAVGV
ncbi:MAG TPA: intradiol ring-cleavage dioxygenase [Tepidiformaceae bacterium]|nr:intradiol ring-cleavage dioxygenase [Tepidiformaceae bacterium]